VVLVQIVPGVGEDHVGLEPALQVLEHVLDLSADVREEPIAKAVHDDLGAVRPADEGGGARPRLAFPYALRTEHDPGHLDVRTPSDQAQQARAATDLDVVCVRTKGEDLAYARPAGERKVEH
jgi:hypothetical protein